MRLNENGAYRYFHIWQYVLHRDEFGIVLVFCQIKHVVGLFKYKTIAISIATFMVINQMWYQA